MTMELASPHLEVGLVSNDAERLTGFYRDVLGFPVVGSVDIPNVGTITRFHVGDCILRVLAPADRASAAPDGAFSGVVGIRYLALKVRNLSGTVARVTKGGGTIVIPPRNLRPGVDVAIVSDPDGNAIELMQEISG